MPKIYKDQRKLIQMIVVSKKLDH